MNSGSFAVTLFKSSTASTMAEEVFTLDALVERIRATSRARKDLLPWLKLPDSATLYRQTLASARRERI